MTSLLPAYATKNRHPITQPLYTCHMLPWNILHISPTRAGCGFSIPLYITNIHGGITTLLSAYFPSVFALTRLRPLPPPPLIPTYGRAFYHTTSRHASTFPRSTAHVFLNPFLTLLHRCLTLTSTAVANGTNRVASDSLVKRFCTTNIHGLKRTSLCYSWKMVTGGGAYNLKLQVLLLIVLKWRTSARGRARVASAKKELHFHYQSRRALHTLDTPFSCTQLPITTGAPITLYTHLTSTHYQSPRTHTLWTPLFLT